MGRLRRVDWATRTSGCLRQVDCRYRIRYGDIFRAVGHFLDKSLFRDLTIVETPDGFIVKGGTIRSSEGGIGFTPQSYLFTDSDLEDLLEQAMERRGSGTTVEGMLPSVTIEGERMRYEDALRSMGLLVDKIGWREIVLMQTASGFHLKGVLREEPVDRLIDANALRGLVDDVRQGREPRDAPKRRFWPR